MIKNSQGKIAVKWIMPRNPPPVKIDGTDRIYNFSASWHVWMTWIEEQDLDRLLKQKAKVCNCNNGTYKLAFETASRMDVGIFEKGDRHYLNPDYIDTEA